MIICQNCGTTNNEASSHTCRKCGALLPVSSRTSRSKRLQTDKKKKEKNKPEEQNSIESSDLGQIQEEKHELHEIPKGNKIELQEIPTHPIEDIEIESSQKNEYIIEEKKSEVLQEIPAQPYRGAMIDSQKSLQPPPLSPIPPSRSMNAISDAFMELKSSVLEDQDKNQVTPITPKPPETDEFISKQKRLEKDMTEVLGFLSKKISVKKLEIPKPEEKEESGEEIPPSSMNEILKRLLKLDLNIEASAIIKTDGTILASAISSRISDSLFATIGMNLSMMGSDIIHGLDAGTLKSISVRGTDGFLDLAPIDKEDPSVKDMILIILSHPKAKSGIISFAINIVKKQLKEYLGIEK